MFSLWSHNFCGVTTLVGPLLNRNSYVRPQEAHPHSCDLGDPAADAIEGVEVYGHFKEEPTDRALEIRSATVGAMSIWEKVRGLLGGAEPKGYAAEASVDLDILDAHDQASKLLIGVDFSRLERRNKERRSAAHLAIGDLHVEGGELRWNPHRLERSCGVRPIEFRRADLRSIERKPGAVVAVLKDGANVPFVVSTQGVAGSSRRGFARPRPSRQEPPLIS